MTLKQKNVPFDQVWPDIERDLSSLYHHTDVSQVSAMDVFNNIYSLCVSKPQPHVEKLLQSIEKLLDLHISTVRQNILHSPHGVVAAYAVEWSKYWQASNWLQQCCGYLNRVLMASSRSEEDDHMMFGGGINGGGELVARLTQNRMTVEAFALYMWKERVLDYFKHTHNDVLMTALFALIKDSRNQVAGIDFDSIKISVSSLLQLDTYTLDTPMKIYLDEYEHRILAETSAYYENESKQLLGQMSVRDYLGKIDGRLNDEQIRISQFGGASTHAQVINACEVQLISKPSAVIYPEFHQFILTGDIKAMNLFFRVFSRLRNGVIPLAVEFQRHVAKVGSEAMLAVKMSKSPAEIVQTCVSVFEKYSAIVANAFADSSIFEAAVDKALRAFINEAIFVLPIAEIVARYADALLRKNGPLSTSSVERNADATIIVFKYIDDKDIFQKHYARLLARRLIFNSSISIDLEGEMISKLKSVCGLEYTSKLQRMFSDIGISQELNGQFKEHLKSSSINLMMDTNMLILTAGAWPLAAAVPTSNDISVPAMQISHLFETPIVTFTNFYNKRYNGRRLSWLHQMSRVDIQMFGFDKPYDANCSMLQASILLEFNSCPQVDVMQIVNVTKNAKDAVESALKLLSDFGLLNPTLNGKYGLNERFTSKKLKVKLPSASTTAASVNEDGIDALSPQSPNTPSSNHRELEEERRIFIQATIVRFMKTNNCADMNAIIQECVDKSRARFNPSVQIIRKCVDQLVDKQYIGLVSNTNQLEPSEVQKPLQYVYLS